MKGQLTARRQRARDLPLLVCMVATCVLVFCVLVVSDIYFERGWFLFLYALISVFSIVDLYFHYSLCRWHNRWHRTLHESGGAAGEPSAFALVMSKISGWALFIFIQLIAFLPVILPAVLRL